MFSLALAIVLSRPFPFIDEGRDDKQLQEFRTNLLNSVKLKKYDWVVNRIADDIKFSFGGEDGKDDLLAIWETSPRAKEEFFEALLAAMNLGGQFQKFDDERYFVAPYVFSAWPEDLDAFEHVAVLGRERAVYNAADEAASVVARLSECIVKVSFSADAVEGWRNIAYADEKWGWIRESSTRSPIAHRAMFEKRDENSYYLVTFIAGD